MIGRITKLKYRESGNFFLIAGPCVVENEKLTFEIAEKLVAITDKLKIPYIFKASYRKANRSRLDSFKGIGDEKALKIIKSVGDTLKIPTITDVHTPQETEFAAKFTDILQIPAFLCRQTDLLISAGKTGRWVNIKKGQFISPEAMQFAVDKVKQTGNVKVMVTERGNMFGYQDLIIDFRGIAEMKKLKVPVVLDVTHSLQQPNQKTGVTGGKPELIETMARAGIAVGTDGLFLETHPNPAIAKSDGANMIKLDKVEDILKRLVKIRKTINSF
ncbi:MAG: 3-deoxy-8-phosphooctulonate synthase [Chlorobi bacterium]|nr:3-deoxy-8-phosphooctulonate synthase [Chlorobiota bacterium]